MTNVLYAGRAAASEDSRRPAVSRRDSPWKSTRPRSGSQHTSSPSRTTSAGMGDPSVRSGAGAPDIFELGRPGLYGGSGPTAAFCMRSLQNSSTNKERYEAVLRAGRRSASSSAW